MRVACVFVEHFPFKIEFRENPIIGEYKDVIIFGRQGSRSSVIDVSPSLGSVGYGMSLQEAVARYPEATIVESDLGCYDREFDKLVDALSERIDEQAMKLKTLTSKEVADFNHLIRQSELPPVFVSGSD